MTDFAVYTQPYNPEDLSWDLSGAGEGVYAEGATLDISKFTQAQHFPNGYIPSGTILGKVTASGLLGPYLDAASDGTQTAVGILRGSIRVVTSTGAIKSKVGCSVVKAFQAVSISHLPFNSTSAAAGGYIDANGQADLPRIHFAA